MYQMALHRVSSIFFLSLCLLLKAAMTEGTGQHYFRFFKHLLQFACPSPIPKAELMVFVESSYMGRCSGWVAGRNNTPLPDSVLEECVQDFQLIIIFSGRVRENSAVVGGFCLFVVLFYFF